MSYQTPNYQRQGGTDWVLGGTLSVPSGGSVQVASGGVINIAAGGSIRAPANAVSFGGLPGTYTYGSVVLTNGGSATIGVGFAITSVAPIIVGLDGSISGVAVNTSLYSAGSAILYGMSGTLATTTQRGTVGYTVFG